MWNTTSVLKEHVAYVYVQVYKFKDRQYYWARRDETTQQGHWQVAISLTQLSTNIRKRGTWGDQQAPIGEVFYIEGASSYK